MMSAVFSMLSINAYAAAHQKGQYSIEEALEHPKMPSLDIHGMMAMGYYNVSQATMPAYTSPSTPPTTYPAMGGTYSGLGLGYLFRPGLQIASSVEVGETVLQAISGLSTRPTSSILNDSFNRTQQSITGNNTTNSADALFQRWTLSISNPNYGTLEAGKALTESAKSIMATFSPFHRLRGGYEDAVTALTEVATYSIYTAYAPLITYFGATSALIDAPHISYKTPDYRGFTVTSEYAPAAYLTDIGGTAQGAYAVAGQYSNTYDDLKYDARISYADNVLNGYPAILAYNQLNNLSQNVLYYNQLVFGSQVNASAAIGYKGIDASLSYGHETNSSSPLQYFGGGFASSSLDPLEVGDAANIKPSIIEGTVGYTFNTMMGGKTGILATYALARDYARFFDENITSSKATMWGVGVGQFIGNLSMELRVQRYNTNGTITTGSSFSPVSYSGNIISLGTTYLF